jgi:ATP/maltotriose-dependent transcriptional regulator MalT
MSIYPRQRITEALQDSANRGLAMLIAPAGFGKSEAASDAFGQEAHWVDLPDAGASVETLARLLIEKTVPRSMRALSALLARPDTDANRIHLADWCAAKLRSVEQPIIFEDFQRICADIQTLRFVRTVIEATVPNVRWVIISRETPELPIGTWLARDYLTLPLSADDLAFEVSESAGVARALDVAIEPSALGELVRDVGGWPLAVRLSLAAWDRTRALPPLRIRTRVVLFDFIEEQVWSFLSEDDQHFFEAAAHLSELRPRILSAAGFPEARLTLERLHLRLPLLSRLGNGAFRLHELFRDFLLERSRRNSERHQALVGRLARALERFGDVDSSIALYMRAQEWDQAIALLTRHGIDRIENGHKAEVVASLARFPRPYLDHPIITGLRGFALAIDGAFAVAKREIEQSLKGDLGSHFRGSLSIQLATISVNTGEPAEAVPILKQLMVDEQMESNVRLIAAALLATASALAGEIELARDAIGFCSSGLNSSAVEIRALVAHRLSHAHFYLGELGVAEGYATQSVQLATSVGLDAIASRAYAILQSVAAGTYSDTLLVRKYADACTRAAISAGDRTMQIYGHQSQLLVAAYQGDDDLYDRTDRALLDMGAERPNRNLMWIRYAKVLREVGRGNVALAISVVKSIDSEKISPAEKLFADSLHALLLATRQRDEALSFLARPILIAATKDFESRRILAHAQVYHALAQWLVGRGRAARRAPTPDLSAVFPRDAALLTVMTTICSMSRQTTTERQVAQLTEPLLALQMDGQARFLRLLLAPTNVSTLTRTELDVLRELRGGGTTADVADRLGRSSHTVLSHLKSACSKIGCSGRAAAVAYAVDMGWLD